MDAPVKNFISLAPEADPTRPVHLTDAALVQVRAALEQENATRAQEGTEPALGLRVAVAGGGCAGFQYSLDFERDDRPGDARWEVDGVTLWVDRFSNGYLTGCVVDYVEGPMGSGFKFENPNVNTTCGCGSSFS